MSINDLVQKANHNYQTAEWAEKNFKYDAAISRYYYAIYEKMLFLLMHSKDYVKPISADGSHVSDIDQFIGIYNDLEDDDTKWVARIKRIKSERRKSDYNPDILIDRNRFTLTKLTIVEINNVMDQLIEKKGRSWWQKSI